MSGSRGRGGQSSRHATRDDEASMRGIIVLDSARSKTKPRRRTDDANAERSIDTSDTTDPDVLRKIVRRQAALASADRRRATIAASRLKQRSKETEGPRQQESAESHTTKAVVQPSRPPAFVFDLGRNKIDPFCILPHDLTSVQDTNLLHRLFSYIIEVAAPMMDLRLPTIYDRMAVTKPKWANEMPVQAMRSAPAFWSVMTGAATAKALDDGRHPSSDTLTLKFRQMAIQAVNSHLHEFNNKEPDLAILGSISVLGAWERTWGTDDAWQAHRRGMKAVAFYLCQGGPQNALYAQVLAFADQDLVPVPVLRSPRSDEGSIVELGVGFRKLQDVVFIDNNLVNALLSCESIEDLEEGREKAEGIQDVATEIGRYSPSVAFTSIAHRDPKRDRRGDTILLQLHMLLQAAGFSMIRHFEPGAACFAILDLPAIFKTAIVSAKSVATVRLYNEILFWAMATIWALNRDAEAEEEGIEAVRLVAEELQLASSPHEAWERALQRFVFLESARPAYERLWYRVMLLQDQQTILDPAAQDIEYNCQTQ